MHKKFKILFIVFFLALIVAPNLDTIFKIDPVAQRSENRARASFPHWPSSMSDFKKLASDFDSYYTDNFGFRNSLIKINAIVKFFVLHTSPTDRVVIGKDEGWLFLARQENVESYRNLHPFTDKELEAFVLKIRERDAWSKKNGMQYIYMVGPDSHTINSEHLPTWATKVNPGSRFDQLIEYAKRTANIDILDVRPALFEGKKHGLVSYKTDSHWNGYGAYLAYREIVKRIQQAYPNVKDPISAEDYELRETNQEGLDLTTLMGLKDLVHENGQEFYYKKADVFKVTEQQGLHFTTVNPDVEDFPIAIVCDSMAGNLSPHMARQFSKVRYLWGYPFEPDEIMKYHPKVLIHLVIERTLLWDQLPNPEVVKAAL